MKVSLNWIKDYVDLPQDMDLTRLAYDLTMSTVEVEGAEDLARRFDHMLVGRITEVCPHPNADKLQICRTDIGGGDIRDIVCGGTNVRPGMKVAVAAPGAMCRWHGEGEPVEIKEAKLRGVKSYGMICGAAEIGLGDLFPTTEEAHILDLSDFDAAAGTPIADALDLNDIILEIDNKSMTNRPDLWGHYGIARELAALYDLPLKPLPPFTCGAGSDGLNTVTVEDTERCPRYIGAAVEGLSVKPAPFRMQSRIWRVGMRPINALVDITNYVMLATGQPTHAFDSDNIAGHIIVRRAKDGEQLELLNTELIRMGALCEDGISQAAKVLVTRDEALRRAVDETEQEIDRKEREIEAICLRLLLQQQPVAKDLRLISAAMKMIADMERIGDQASDIAEMVEHIRAEVLPGSLHIAEMARAAVKMVTNSVDSFVRRDIDFARAVEKADDEVDALFNKVKSEIIALIAEKPEEGETCLDLLMVAKYFERIGDHAVNIAEWVVFSLTGEHD